MAGEFGISRFGQDFLGRFATREEAAKALGGRRGYVGRYVDVEYTWPTNGLAEKVIEEILYRASEKFGDAVEDGLECSTEAREELDKLLEAAINNWIDRHALKPRLYQVVDVEEVIT